MAWVHERRPEDRSGLEALDGPPVTFELYPTATELESLARKKYPYLDWEEKSRIGMADYTRARAAAIEALEAVAAGESKSAGNTTDFGTVVAYRLEPYVYVSDSDQFEYFDTCGCQHGLWKVTKKERALKKLVRQVLLTEFRPSRATLDKEKRLVFAHYGESPGQCKKAGFRNSVAEDASLLLLRQPRRPLDDDSTRHLLQDANGVVYDYAARRFVASMPCLRLSRHVLWKFGDNPEAAWGAPSEVKRELKEILRKIFEYWLAGDGPAHEGANGAVAHKTLDEEPFFGAPLARQLRDFVMGSEFCRYWHVVLPVYDMNVDEALWKTLHLSANAFAWARRCELVYEYGPGSSGKDTVHTISNNFFGSRAQEGFAGVVPATWFTSKHVPNPDAPSATLDSFRNMRYLANNEVPAHTWFNFDAAKPICEQEGAWILSRGLYKDPEPWRSMGGLALTSNHPMVLDDTQREDTGVRRRLNHSKMRRTFSPLEGKEIKASINRGELNHEVFWLTRVFREYVERMPGTRMVPIPPRVLKETAELLSAKKVVDVKAWLEANTTWATYASATDHLTLRKVIAKAFNLDEGSWKAIFDAAGLKPKASGPHRRYGYFYPDRERMECVKLNDGVYERYFPAPAAA